jgi:thioredoxin
MITMMKFGAAWCGPCRTIAPVVEKLAADYAGRVTLDAVDIEERPEVAQRFGITNIPTLLVLKEGKVVAQLVGAVSRSRIEDALRKAL